jgi:tetratricopeptide (TPR) repeat protein
MGKKLVEQLVSILNKVEWPAEEQPTDQGLEAYKVGLERVENYRDDPQALVTALRTFQSGGSRPFAFAGVAYMMVAAARDADGSYDETGLNEAMDWLEKAQAGVLDRTEINFIEALIYVYDGRLDDARLILDYLHEQEPHNFYVYQVEAEYWRARGDLQQTIHWLENSIKEAQTVPERMRQRRKMADCYFDARQYEPALPIYKEVAQVDTTDHLIWHRIALCHWQQEDYAAANDANKRALALKEFSAGRRMEQALKEKLDTGMLGRLFGR